MEACYGFIGTGTVQTLACSPFRADFTRLSQGTECCDRQPFPSSPARGGTRGPVSCAASCECGRGLGVGARRHIRPLCFGPPRVFYFPGTLSCERASPIRHLGRRPVGEQIRKTNSPEEYHHVYVCACVCDYTGMCF